MRTFQGSGGRVRDGDYHLAEDAAQEAFLDAYRLLPALKEPAAFPAWLRRIAFTTAHPDAMPSSGVAVPPMP